MNLELLTRNPRKSDAGFTHDYFCFRTVSQEAGATSGHSPTIQRAQIMTSGPYMEKENIDQGALALTKPCKSEMA
jgi:hypothetical protein